MNIFSPKGIAAGVAAFIALFAAAFFTTNLSSTELSAPVMFILWSSAWIIPGYTAARFSPSNNLANSATAGALVGAASGTILLIAIDQSMELPMSNSMLFSGCTLGAALLFCLGGLIWKTTSKPRSGNL
ncbi:hypothetical protein [Aquipseudomonas alcaligenes]|uniref:hypothetical protein n=1 Tax=Aquipseudomonas alcaligenes TaxID=43263 RepID=UPI001115935B|nr:hypothetical protein [Pseudomonas alcaligenes]